MGNPVLQIWYSIGILLREIARNDRFRLRHFMVRNLANIANKKAIKDSRNCAESSGNARNWAECNEILNCDLKFFNIFQILKCLVVEQ